MATDGRGLICLALTRIVDPLKLHPMGNDNTSRFRTAFTVSVEARTGVTTGISAADRAHTILTATNRTPTARPRPTRPRVPVARARRRRARARGADRRVGRSGAAGGDAARGRDLRIMNDDGTMARVPRPRGVRQRARAQDALASRASSRTAAQRASGAPCRRADHAHRRPTAFHRSVYTTDSTTTTTWRCGAASSRRNDEDALVRVHSECLTGDVFGSLRCDCGDQLHTAMAMIADEGRGVSSTCGRRDAGSGWPTRCRPTRCRTGAWTPSRPTSSSVSPRPARLRHRRPDPLRPRRTQLRLLTNNPRKVVGLDGHGLEVCGRVPIEIEPRPENRRYLLTKCQKLGHLISGMED